MDAVDTLIYDKFQVILDRWHTPATEIMAALYACRFGGILQSSC